VEIATGVGVGVVVEPPVPVRLTTLEPTVIEPVLVPEAVGLKTRLMVQLEPAASVGPQVPTPPHAYAPAMVSVPKLWLVLPLLLNVTSFTALVLPTAWLPKDSEDGEKVTGEAAEAAEAAVVDPLVPVRLTTMEPTVIEPVLVPEAVGLKTRLMVQLEPAASVGPQVPTPPHVYAPAMASVPKLWLLLPILLNVTSWTALVVPTAWLPKDSEDGEKLTVAKLATATAAIIISSARRRFMVSPANNNMVRSLLLTSANTPTPPYNFNSLPLGVLR
jgi:hypothetical protein